MFHPSPLRYPGGKRKLIPFIKLLFKINNLEGGEYIEPYAGGASIALSLLFNEYVSKIHINDLSLPIYAFWYSVLNNAERFCQLIENTEITMDEWHRQKEIRSNYEIHSLFDLGFSTFFLNRTNRSGILDGGVIGGKNQNGDWKLDCRFNKKNLTNRIKKISEFKEQINIYNLDAAVFINEITPSLNAKSLIYLDPPYYLKGKKLYRDFYTHQDHEVIAQLVVNKINSPWIVSYDNTPEIQKMYAGLRHQFYNIHYSAADRYEGSEVMIFSNNLKIPTTDNPSKIKASQINHLAASFSPF